MKIYRAVYYGWEGIEEEHFFSSEELAKEYIKQEKLKNPRRLYNELECEEIEVMENQEQLIKHLNEYFNT